MSSDLQALVETTNGRYLRVADILEQFPQRGHSLIFILLSFPLMLPISIPFIAGPFGLVMAFTGLFLFMGKTPWLPRSLRERPVSHEFLERSVARLLRVFQFIEHLLRPRLFALSTGTLAVRCHAIYVLFLSVLLALPVPFTNAATAIPIFLCGLGLLEEDGLLVLVSYIVGIPCTIYYGVVVWLGEEGVMRTVALLHLASSN